MNSMIQEMCQKMDSVRPVTYAEILKSRSADDVEKIKQYEKAGLHTMALAVERAAFTRQMDSLGYQQMSILDAARNLPGGEKARVASIPYSEFGTPSSIEIGTRWRTHFIAAPVGDLRHVVPYGVVLRMNELRESGLMTDFIAVGPRDAFNIPAMIDPILLGYRAEIPGWSARTPALLSGAIPTFFVASW